MFFLLLIPVTIWAVVCQVIPEQFSQLLGGSVFALLFICQKIKLCIRFRWMSLICSMLILLWLFLYFIGFGASTIDFLLIAKILFLVFLFVLGLRFGSARTNHTLAEVAMPEYTKIQKDFTLVFSLFLVVSLVLAPFQFEQKHGVTGGWFDRNYFAYFVLLLTFYSDQLRLSFLRQGPGTLKLSIHSLSSYVLPAALILLSRSTSAISMLAIYLLSRLISYNNIFFRCLSSAAIILLFFFYLSSPEAIVQFLSSSVEVLKDLNLPILDESYLNTRLASFTWRIDKVIAYSSALGIDQRDGLATHSSLVTLMRKLGVVATPFFLGALGNPVIYSSILFPLLFMLFLSRINLDVVLLLFLASFFVDTLFSGFLLVLPLVLYLQCIFDANKSMLQSGLSIS